AAPISEAVDRAADRDRARKLQRAAPPSARALSRRGHVVVDGPHVAVADRAGPPRRDPGGVLDPQRLAGVRLEGRSVDQDLAGPGPATRVRRRAADRD